MEVDVGWWIVLLACGDPADTGADTDDSAAEVCVDAAGVSHPIGDSWPDTDGCNTCSCDSGDISCTDLGCIDTDT